MTTGPAPTSAPAAPRVSRPRRRHWLGRVAGLGSLAIVLGLVGLNAWRLADDLFPPPELGPILRLVERKQFDEAERALRARLRRSPHHGEARAVLARLLIRKGDRAGAVAQLHEVPAWWPSKREALFIEGQLERQLGRARRAEAAWWECLRDDPLHPTSPTYFAGAAKGLLEIYAVEGRMDEAREVVWEDYLQDSPAERPELMIRWLNATLLRIENKEAVGVLRTFVAADREDWQARLALARLEQADGRPAEADRLIRECLALRPRDARVWREWLAILTQRGDRAARAEVIARLPPQADADAPTWAYRGIDRLESDRPDLPGAASAFRRALVWRPFDEELYFRLAGVERRLGEGAKAQGHMRRYKALKAVRDQLNGAADDFARATREGPSPGRPDPATASRRLAELCESLGWPRASEAFLALAAGG